MKVKFTSLFLIIIASISFAQKKQLTLDDIFLSNKFITENVENVRWKPDSSAFAFTKNNSSTSLNDIYLFDLNTLEERLFCQPKNWSAITSRSI